MIKLNRFTQIKYHIHDLDYADGPILETNYSKFCKHGNCTYYYLSHKYRRRGIVRFEDIYNEMHINR